MENFFDDFDDDYDEGESMDEDSFEDSLEENLEMDDEPIEAESQDDEFTARDAFFLGSFFGFAFEEGLKKRKQRKHKKFKDDSD